MNYFVRIWILPKNTFSTLWILCSGKTWFSYFLGIEGCRYLHLVKSKCTRLSKVRNGTISNFKPEKTTFWNLKMEFTEQNWFSANSKFWHFLGPYYGSNNCLMSQFQKSTQIFNWNLFQDHATMLQKITVKYGGPCRVNLRFQRQIGIT